MKSKLVILSVTFMALLRPLPADNEIGFIEKFALAADREKALAELAPGTEEFFFYHALHYQNTKNAAKLKAALDDWGKNFPSSSMRDIIENREALLAYDADPQRTLAFLRNKLNLQFNHQQEVRNQKPNLPTSLDAARISRDVFLAQSMKQDDLVGMSEIELERLVREKTPLRVPQIRALLSRITAPTVPGLVEMIATEINRTDGTGFGTFPIHHQLLPDQLDELLKLAPRIEGEPKFVSAKIRKLQPGADEDADFDPVAREAWLERVWAYVRTLPPVFNSLKAYVLFRRLDHDRKKGVYDRERFLDYLELPRRTHYIAVRLHEQLSGREIFWCDLNATFHDAALHFGPIGSDEALVRDYFIHILPVEAEKSKADPIAAIQRYTEYVNADWLKPVFAEAMIISGRDKPERWSSLLSSAQFAALKERVDIEFASDNTQSVTIGDDVSVDLFLKNVPKLLVRIYEINTLGFFLQNRRQLNTDLNLDGLVANTEATHNYTEPPFLRTRRSFSFPELKGKRGAWVIEFIGGGRSSRALIRTGQWHLVQRTGPAGDLIRVLDEKHQLVKDAVVWLDGRRLAPDEKTGFIAPFTAQPGRKSIVLADAAGTFATLSEFEHHAEDYRLDAQFYLNREQLLARREATLAIRTALFAGDASQPLSLLKDAKLTITTTTLDGVNTTLEVKTVALESDKLFPHVISVPDRLQTVTVTLTAGVEQLSQGGNKAQLSAHHAWQVNQIDQSEVVDAGHISKFGDAYVFELLGRNGEPEADRQVVFTFNRDGFPHPVSIALRTDAKGQVMLGSLDGINSVAAQSLQWKPARDSRTLATDIHASTEDTIQVPLTRPYSAGAYSLLEIRGADFTADHNNRITTAGLGATVSQLNISGLAPGDYKLLLHGEGRVVSIRVTKGTVGSGWVFGTKRNLQLQGLRPLNIAGTELKGDDLLVKLVNVNPYTRVHVAASRFMPEFPVFPSLSGFTRFSPASEQPEKLPNLFSAGREIGDEYRYILDRRFAKIFPGNMLTRPGLLLNPWELRVTGQTSFENKRGEAASQTLGERRGLAMAPKPQAAESQAPGKAGYLGIVGSNKPNLDFLASIAPVLLNLVPDKDGVVRVPKKLLGDRQFIEVYAEDLGSAVQHHVTLPEAGTKFSDLRLARSLDPAKPFSEKKQSTVLQTGGKLTLADIRTSELESYDTLGGVFSLYTTLSGNAELAKFAWLLQWPKMKDDEKRSKYSEFACHELSFFLSRKDPAFFEKVIKPYLANKKEKTFLDDYLLGADLHRYLGPWRYSKLNAAERALLGRRLPEETKNAARHLRDLWELLVPNLQQQNHLFETALRGRAMDAEAESDAKGEGRDKGTSLGRALESEKLKMAKNMPAAPAMAAMAESNTSAIDAISMKIGPSGGAAVVRKLNEAAKDSKKRAGAKEEQSQLGDFAEKAAGMDGARRDDSALFAAFDADQAGVEELRKQVRAYYRQLGPVKEWAENQYWHLPLAQQGPELITVNAFWRDLAEWDGKGAFVSSNLAEAHRNFAEIMFALGVLDLPFDAPAHKPVIEAGRMTLTAGGPVVVFHKEILPATAAPAGQAPALLVSQAFFRYGDRYRMEGNLKFDKYITTEFLSGAVYGANIVVTNPASAPADLDLLLQIPQGALPVLRSRTTSSQHILLEPYTTKTFEYYFYFPHAGAGGAKFTHYPVNTSVRGTAVAAAGAFSFNVVDKLTEVDKASWDYVSQYGTDAEALAFLMQNNIERLNIERVAWRCRQGAGFFRSLIGLLRQRHRYDATIYSYAVMHNETGPLVEFLKHRDDLLNQCGAWFDSKLVHLDPIERRSYEHLEYSPLVNQRAHRIGAERRIATPEQLAQYQRLLHIVAHKPALDAVDEMSVAYHLFLQDRVEEALTHFHTVQADGLPVKLQHDYFRCYAAFYEGNLPDARGVAMQHANEPVTRWRELFAEVASQLDEIEGKGAKGSEKPDREKAQAALAATEPVFDFKVEKQTLALTWKNLREVTVNYYLMDPEFAFSSSPFVSQGAGRFSIIKPNRSAKLTLPEGKETLDTPLPGEYAKANVLIEVLGAGQRKAKAHHANTLKLTVTENYGRLEVRDSNNDKALSKAYVKVYARLQGGTVRFFKDGYTDLRGRFDYASLNSPTNANVPAPRGNESPANGLDYHMLKPGELGSVEKLSVLILSETNGAEVREVGPPSE